MKGEFAQVLEVVLSGGKWTPDRIKEARPSITLSCETIGHNLRRARRKGLVESCRDYISESGQAVTEYFAPTPKSDKPVYDPVYRGAVFFYSFAGSKEPSGYFTNLEAAKKNADGAGILGGCRFWTGSHDAPIPVDQEAKP